MTKETLQENLTAIKGAIQQRWDQLTDHDLEKMKHQRDKIIDLIQEKYGEEKESIEKTLNHLIEKYAPVAKETMDCLRHKKDDIIDCTHQLSKDLHNEIKRNPLRSVLIGLAVGFIVGKISK